MRRLAIGVGLPAILIAGCARLLRGGRLLCVFYELTGLYCPGCGSGRAALALLHGDPAAALGYNALFTLLLLPCGIVLAREYLRPVFPGLGLRPLRLPARVGGAALVLLLAFGIARNLPAFAFLAP